MIYDVIQSLVVLIKKLTFFNKQLKGFTISLNNMENGVLLLKKDTISKLIQKHPKSKTA